MKKVVAVVTAVAFAVAGMGGAYWYGTKSVVPAGQVAAGWRARPGTRPRAEVRPRPGAGNVTVEAVKVATASLPQTITAVGQPALRRIGHAAAGSGRPDQHDRLPGRPARRQGRDARPARSRRAAGRSAAGARQPRAGQDQVRSRRRPGQEQLHFGSGQGRSGEQLQGGGGVAAAGRGQAREDGHARAVLRNHRPALGVGRRLREGRRRPRQPRVDRSAEGRLPRARDLHAAGAGRPAAAGAARRAARQDVRGQGVRGESADRRRGPLGGDPRDGAQSRHQPAPGNVRARAAHHARRAGRAGAAGAGAGAAGRPAVRLPHRRRQGRAREGGGGTAQRRQGRDSERASTRTTSS